MKPSHRSRAHFSAFSSTTTTGATATATATATVTTISYNYANEHSTSGLESEVAQQIPVQSSPSERPEASAAAVKIQSAFRSHAVRSLVNKIRSVNSQANYWEKLIQRQETVDAVRSDERERIKINEALMGLLFRLDSVPGFNPTVRELRRHVSRRIVGLQEILDAVADTKVENWDGFLREWDDILAGIEKEACKDRGGGYELERFCAQHLGFRCLERFLQDQ